MWTNLNSFQDLSAEQRGASNRANLGQDSYGDAATRGFGTFAIGQNGSSHHDGIFVAGIDTKATVEQNGVANQASIVSVGDGNLATVRQGGQANMAFIDQNTLSAGYGNVASIIQRNPVRQQSVTR